jgi:predicted GNAT family N-acyltransferase
MNDNIQEPLGVVFGEFRLATTSAPHDLSQIYKLRVAAWRPHEDIPPETTEWTDEFDRRAEHFAIYRNDEIIAAARLSWHMTQHELPDVEVYHGSDFNPPRPIGCLGRCVVHPAFRKRGLATILDKERIRRAKDSMILRSLVTISHRAQRGAQFESYGFMCWGQGGFSTEGPLHMPAKIYLLQF